MTSTTSKIENGVIVFVCGPRKRHPERCTYCTRPRVATCDFKLYFEGPRDGEIQKRDSLKRCNASLCGQCKRTIGDRDECRVHEIRGDREIVPGAHTGGY